MKAWRDRLALAIVASAWVLTAAAGAEAARDDGSLAICSLAPGQDAATATVTWQGYLGARHRFEGVPNLGAPWAPLPCYTNLAGGAEPLSATLPLPVIRQFVRLRCLPGRLRIVPDKWSLWASGTQLRGANVYQRRVYPALDGPTIMGPGPCGPPYAQADFDALAALGANYVNISHPGLFAESPPYALDGGMQANLDRLLAMAGEAGLLAVIAFRTGPGRSEFAIMRQGDWFPPGMINDAVWSNAGAQTAWVAMWQHTAARYRGQPVVVGYDLMVEPNACEVVPGGPVWDPPVFHALFRGTTYDWNQLHPRIAAAIRAVDSATPLLVGGDGYSNIAWLPYVLTNGDARTVYAIHTYEPFPFTHQAPNAATNTYPGYFDGDWDGAPETIDAAWLGQVYAPVDQFMSDHGVPVAVNEFGVNRWAPGAAQFLADQVGLLEARGINHAAWIWECSYAPYAENVTSFNFRLGADPANVSDQPTNALLRTLQEFWQRNLLNAW